MKLESWLIQVQWGVIDIGEAGDMADTGPVAVIDIGEAGDMADTGPVGSHRYW